MNRGMLPKTINYIRNVDEIIAAKPIDNVFKAYSNAVRELIELDGCDMYENNTIIVEPQVIDDVEYSHVYLSDGTETWAMDFTDWNGLIDLQIDDKISVDVSEMLAHVLYEITWWGFTRESINQQARELEDLDKDNLIEVDWSEYIDDKDS